LTAGAAHMIVSWGTPTAHDKSLFRHFEEYATYVFRVTEFDFGGCWCDRDVDMCQLHNGKDCGQSLRKVKRQ